jgi:serine/threonine protein kinase
MERDQLGGVIGFRTKPVTLKNCKTKNKTCETKIKQFSITCFKKFTKHATVRLLGQGTYGKAFLLTIKNAVLSPYVDIEGNSVKVLLVKIGFITHQRSRSKKQSIVSTTVADFEKESNTQQDIFQASLKTFDSALCPAIVYLDIVPTTLCKQWYPKLYDSINAPNHIEKFSMIGMETYEHVDNLYNYGMSETLQDTVFFQLLRLGALGYAHGDPSSRNIILDKDTKRPYLIDFGNVQKLSVAETSFMKKQLANFTDMEGTLKIMLKGFPHGFPNLRNWDWLKFIDGYTPLSKNAVANLVDKNWSQVL